MDLASYTRPELVVCPLAAEDGPDVLRAVALRLQLAGVARSADEVFQKLIDREQLSSTGIGSGVAVPHCKLEGLASPVLVVVLADKPGVDFGAVDGNPVRLFFTVVSPEQAPAEHLQVLAAVSRWVKCGEPVERMLSCRTSHSILSVLRTVEEPVGVGAESQ